MKEMCLRRCCPSKLEVTYHNTSVWQTDVTGIKVDINKYKYKKTPRIDCSPVQEQMAEFGLKSNSALNLDAPSPSAFLLSSFSLSSCLLFSGSLTCTEYYPILICIQLNSIESFLQVYMNRISSKNPLTRQQYRTIRHVTMASSPKLLFLHTVPHFGGLGCR